MSFDVFPRIEGYYVLLFSLILYMEAQGLVVIPCGFFQCIILQSWVVFHLFKSGKRVNKKRRKALRAPCSDYKKEKMVELSCYFSLSLILGIPY